MATVLICSHEPRAGRTAVAAGLGALLAKQRRSVLLARLRSPEESAPAAEDDARTLASVPGCEGPANAVTEQEALAIARDAGTDGFAVIEAPVEMAKDLASKLSGRVLLVTNSGADVATAKLTLGAALGGVIATRIASRRVETIAAEIEGQGVACLGVLPEDRLLAGPNVREIMESLRASALVDGAPEAEAVEYVMLGPISADPGQPYFLQHGSKAVVNRFDKMDLHLAALATEPDCLILTGGQMPSPYLLDRVAGSDFEVTVLLAPESTVRTVETLDDLYGNTRFIGQRKLNRAIGLFRERIDGGTLVAALAT